MSAVFQEDNKGVAQHPISTPLGIICINNHQGNIKESSRLRVVARFLIALRLSLVSAPSTSWWERHARLLTDRSDRCHGDAM